MVIQSATTVAYNAFVRMLIDKNFKTSSQIIITMCLMPSESIFNLCHYKYSLRRRCYNKKKSIIFVYWKVETLNIVSMTILNCQCKIINSQKLSNFCPLNYILHAAVGKSACSHQVNPFAVGLHSSFCEYTTAVLYILYMWTLHRITHHRVKPI